MANILLIEDDQGALGALSKILQRLGHNVSPATDVLSALAIWRENNGNFDTVISDFELANETAKNILVIVRIESPETRIILMSGSPRAVISENFITVCVDSYLAKPFTTEALEGAINAT